MWSTCPWQCTFWTTSHQVCVPLTTCSVKPLDTPWCIRSRWYKDLLVPARLWRRCYWLLCLWEWTAVSQRTMTETASGLSCSSVDLPTSPSTWLPVSLSPHFIVNVVVTTSISERFSVLFNDWFIIIPVWCHRVWSPALRCLVKIHSVSWPDVIKGD